jgi:hypothetical protein
MDVCSGKVSQKGLDMVYRILHLPTSEYLRYPDQTELNFNSKAEADSFVLSGQALGFAKAVGMFPVTTRLGSVEFEVVNNRPK